MQLISLFSGIGGFESAGMAMGWENIVSCETNPFAQVLLKYYWPDSYHHDDIRTLTYEKINEELTKRKGPNWRKGDIILTGGFPCQPFSLAGTRKGTEDTRHLWPEMLRAIKEIRPTWVVGENVRGIISWSNGMVFESIQADLEAEGYEVLPFLIPACGVNAPHRRDRVWFVAYSSSTRLQELNPTGIPDRKGYSSGVRDKELWPTTNTTHIGWSREGNWGGEPGLTNKEGQGYDWENFPTKHPICSRNDGVSCGLDPDAVYYKAKRRRGNPYPRWRNQTLMAYGNAVVPQVVIQIFRAIEGYQKIVKR